jgi:acid stress-induced BolA-like protein IbaG/YrbA
MSAYIRVPAHNAVSDALASDQVAAALRTAIIGAVDDAQVDVSGGNGHYSIRVVSSEFVGKTQLECQQLVYRAIAPWMAGNAAPVHAIDRMIARAPAMTQQSAEGAERK